MKKTVLFTKVTFATLVPITIGATIVCLPPSLVMGKAIAMWKEITFINNISPSTLLMVAIGLMVLGNIIIYYFNSEVPVIAATSVSASLTFVAFAVSANYLSDVAGSICASFYFATMASYMTITPHFSTGTRLPYWVFSFLFYVPSALALFAF